MVTQRNLQPQDAKDLTELYNEYDWWGDRTVPEVRKTLIETDITNGIELNGNLIASCRVLTDYTYYARVFDVIVKKEHQNEGVGKKLMRTTQNHPELQSVPGISLLCREGLAPFYKSTGFEIFGPKVDHPDGNPEELIRMTYSKD